MIRPILATKNPYDAANEFEKAGWKIDFSNPPESGDPLVGVSLCGNQLLLGTMEEKYVNQDAISYIGTGIELYITVPASKIDMIHKGHTIFYPTELINQPWGETTFEVKILGYKFMIAAEE